MTPMTYKKRVLYFSIYLKDMVLKVRKSLSIIIIILLIVLYCYTNKSIDKKTLKAENDYSGLPMAVMVETDYNTNEYETWLDNDWPSDDYVFNNEKSGCENGGSLEWNKDTKTMRMKANTSDRCYAYFDSPLKIYTIEDLVRFGESVNNGTTYAGKTVLLMNDLDFNDSKSYESKAINQNLITGSGFTPIGNATNSFQGTFDGNDKKINSLYINNNDTFAFFGTIKNAYIKNLTLSGNVTSLGGLISNMENSTLDNCVNEVNVTNNFENFATGGLVSIIRGDENSNSNIINCENKGNITGNGYVGGIVGEQQAGNLKIESTVNNGKIETSLGNILGGIIGKSSKANNIIIENTNNYGNIVDKNTKDVEQNVGGIIGENNVPNLVINNTNNEGDIEISRNEFNSFIRINVGGMIGLNQTQNMNLAVKISSSSNLGNIKGGTYISGLVGHNKVSSIIINKSFNEGLIDNSYLVFNINENRANTETGGLIGYNDTAYEYILNSYNAGTINGFDVTGGIISLSQFNVKDALINCYNKGIVNKAKNNISIGAFIRFGSSNYNYLNINNIFNLASKNINCALNIGDIKYNISNAYSIQNIKANKPELMIYLEDNIMKNQDTMQDNKYFIDILNDNLKSINLSEIDPLLKDYTLSKWIKGPDGYPIFDYQKN